MTRRIIRTDGKEVELTIERPTTMQIRALIGAKVLDTVQLRHLGRPTQIMFVDDLAHINELPINEKATALYLANCYPGTTHVIRGDVLIAFDQDFAE